ncbi:MAG: SOS response-associated peptidase [Chloroflexi bacterium]|nr:SOS response-associated peptidase [Chloroflexota bacterium]
MCGRFTLTVDPAELKEAFEDYTLPKQYAPRYNVAPSQPVLAIPNDGLNKADFFVWGLIPSWAKDPAIGSRLINARGETLGEKPSFRGGYKYKRCLILADGFYEWKSQPGTKTKIPHFIHLKTGKPFAFAGLWDEWNPPDGSIVRTCTIVTTTANKLMAPIHDRMPVILKPVDYAQWLDKAPQTPQNLNPLIKPFPAELMEAYPVSALVNSPANERAECILPAN